MGRWITGTSDMIGPLTYLDLALIAVAFISGLLAMYRGFARELLSILSWIVAAGVGYWIYATKKDMTADMADQTSMPTPIATVAVGACRSADRTDRRAPGHGAHFGCHPRQPRRHGRSQVLGFIFGVLRGFFLFVIPYMVYEAFISPDKDKQAPLVRDAFFRDYIKATGETYPIGAATVMPQP